MNNDILKNKFKDYVNEKRQDIILNIVNYINKQEKEVNNEELKSDNIRSIFRFTFCCSLSLLLFDFLTKFDQKRLFHNLLLLVLFLHPFDDLRLLEQPNPP